VPTIRLTSRALDTLLVPARGRVEYFDDSLPGFAVRVFPSGRRVFTLLYRMKGGRAQKKERVDIGTYPPLSLAHARAPHLFRLPRNDQTRGGQAGISRKALGSRNGDGHRSR